ncbi:primosomal protein N' [Desulfosarcina cetonica]|uniref:replication restart helicase PriA n=1 Tax=Desulfosarcina cetonica TaxID=90730 RepID=UPI0006CFA37B|nr:primosomal protein N' [Desulfosarcina cetonica]
MCPVKQNQNEPSASLISVAVVLPVHDCYTYTVPENLLQLACPGKRVRVPFGRRKVTGYVIGPATKPHATALKPILDVLDDEPLFPAAMVPFLKWVANYYIHPLGQVINTALPAGLNIVDVAVMALATAGREALATQVPTALERAVLAALTEQPADLRQLRKKVGPPVTWALIHQLRQREWITVASQTRGGKVRPKTVRMVSPTPGAVDPDRLSPQRQAILDLLRQRGDLSVPTLKEQYPTAPSLVRAMHKAGLVKIYEQTIYRDPFGAPIEPDTPPPLTEEQSDALGRLRPLLDRGFQTVLLAGVTGSGKTEIYLQMTQAAVEKGLHALVLVPEIALIAQTERRFRARFGKAVAVLHSGLSQGERYDQWLRIKRGEATIAIGARSCIFAPFDTVGLIIVDEEHDASYKQDGGLNYNARDMAVVRAQHQHALVILGSATPSVQSWHNVGTGKYMTVGLTQRVNRQPLPAIQTVDLSRLRDERGIRRYLTPVLQEALKQTLDRGQQALIFLNRRGFSSFPICAHCGQPIRCKNCDISLTLHKQANAYLCHYCGFSKAAVSTCPACGSNKIKLLGTGTEKIHEALRHLFPQARIARMDRDTMTRRGAMVGLLKDLKDHRIDILVGTQMVTKGHDFPGITLVGVVCADLTLNFPDFRAGERTFQLLAQVAGRAGRGNAPGKVILQTYNPEHFSIVAAKHQDFATFFNQEIGFRQALGYPPFTRMIAIRISGRNADQTADHARALGSAGQELLAADGDHQHQIQIMGPIEAPLARIANHHRWQLLVKSAHATRLHQFVHELVLGQKAPTIRSGVRVVIDVDPLFLM